MPSAHHDMKHTTKRTFSEQNRVETKWELCRWEYGRHLRALNACVNAARDDGSNDTYLTRTVVSSLSDIQSPKDLPPLKH